MTQPPTSRLALIRVAQALIACLALMVVSGCQSRLPTYPIADGPESLGVIAQRLALVKTVQSGATVEFEEADGAGVRLDAALVAQPPGSLRLRAWKFDRAVLDATLACGELWLLPAEQEQAQGRAEESQRAAEGIRRAFSLLAPAFYESALVDAARTTSPELVVRGTIGDDTLRCVIDRATLTPRRFENAGDDAGTALAIELSDYRVIGTVPWAHTWTISHPRGRVIIRMHDVVLNGDLPPSAFVPPRRAVKSP